MKIPFILEASVLAMLSFIGAGLLPKGAVTASGPVSGMASGSDDQSQNDAVFLADAAGGEMMEVELGQLAQLNSLDPVIKDLGSRMVKDHGQDGDRIKALSAARNIRVPSVLTDERQKIKEGLQKKTGTEFDREYIKLVIDDHLKTIRQFEKEAAGGSDKEIRAFADSSLHMLHAHLEAAQNYQKTVVKE